MNRLLRGIRFIISAFRRPDSWLESYNRKQERRLLRSKGLLGTISRSGKTRFNNKTLLNLLDADWHEGRTWNRGQLEAFLAEFDTVFPSAAIDVLSEFGGLDIGFTGRTVSFGYIREWLRPSHLLHQLTGHSLFPVGMTNIFEDDGLGVLIDSAGRMYVDGPTGSAPPKDYLIELIANNIDEFLTLLFMGKRIPIKQSWYYSQSDIPGNCIGINSIH